MSEIAFEEALELLSNEYRRKILRLITIKERYAFELSKILNISQRAVSNHLKMLKDAELVESEKRKSSKGPDREYFRLNKAVVLSLTLAPNLFLATLRPLDENKTGQLPITPEFQLGSSKEAKLDQVIEEGLDLLPKIKEGLELLEVQQSKLLRGYQGLRNHLKETMEKNNFNSRQIRLMLFLLENDGEMSKDEIEFTMGDNFESLTDLMNELKNRNIIEIVQNISEEGFDFKIKLINLV